MASPVAATDGVVPDNLDNTRKQVNEVQDIMRSNVEKVLERDDKLSQMEDRASRLKEGTEQFQRSAVRIKRKQYWANMKFTLLIGGAAAAIVLLILIWILS